MPSQSKSTTCPHNHNAPYASLQQRVSHIPSSRILKKWKPLPAQSQDRVKAVLLAIKAESQAKRRNTNVTHGRGSKKLDLSDAEYEVVVDELVEKLVKRLPRMPFPENTSKGVGSDNDFDFEATIDRISKLECDLVINVESTKMLREQIRREEALLRRDREEYARLEEGLRSERAVARVQAGRLHAIARTVGEGVGYERGDEHEESDEYEEGDDDTRGHSQGWQVRRRKQPKPALTTKEVKNDPQLAPLVEQLRNHLESMANNVSGLRPVGEALEDAEGAVSAFAWKGLRRPGYEKVVG